MKRLQDRLLIMIVIGIVSSMLIMGGIFLYGFGRIERNRNMENLELKVSRGVESINDTMIDIEKLTTSLMKYYETTMPKNMTYSGEEFDQYVSNSLEVARSVAEHNALIGAIYYRFDPQKAGSQAGFFMSKNQDTGYFEDFEPTDLSMYDPTDREHVAWYYEPVEAGKAIWMIPYYNKNNKTQTISYVIPMYQENKELVGVVGIDLDFELLCEWVDDMKLYEHGYGSIYNTEGQVVYAPVDVHLSKTNLKRILAADYGTYVTYEESGVNYMSVVFLLHNNNYLIYSVPMEEFGEMERRIELAILLATVFSMTVLVRVFTGLIYRSFQHAQKDALTNAYNREVYSSTIYDIEQKFLNERQWKGLSIVVFDVNGLKKINDQFGHAVGDATIREAYDLIHRFFPEHDIYRIGGDEFVIMGNKFDAIHLKSSLDSFKATMNLRAEQYAKGQKSVLVSAGMAYLDEKRHHCFEDVFQEADRRMYENKMKFYEKFPELKR